MQSLLSRPQCVNVLRLAQILKLSKITDVFLQMFFQPQQPPNSDLNIECHFMIVGKVGDIGETNNFADKIQQLKYLKICKFADNFERVKKIIAKN